MKDERQWLACDDAQLLLDHFRGRLRAHSRQLRLYACACSRYIWHLLSDERSRHATEVAERFVDGLASEADLKAAREAAEVAHRKAFEARGKVGSTADWAAVFVVDPLPFHAAKTVNWMAAHAAFHHSGRVDDIPRVELVRDIFGNPFRTPSFGLGLRAPAVVPMARTIYEDRRFDLLPILADALEEAGCSDAGILSHLREPGPHVCGCWALDLILGKE